MTQSGHASEYCLLTRVTVAMLGTHFRDDPNLAHGMMEKGTKALTAIRNSTRVWNPRAWGRWIQRRLKPRARQKPAAAKNWTAVDRYIADLLVPSDSVLDAALSASRDAGLPPINVAPNQGKWAGDCSSDSYFFPRS